MAFNEIKEFRNLGIEASLNTLFFLISLFSLTVGYELRTHEGLLTNNLAEVCGVVVFYAIFICAIYS